MRKLPALVEEALGKGYQITHKGVLVRFIYPSVTDRPEYRMLAKALEATFAWVFWAMRSKRKDYFMGHQCLWDFNELEYDGLCTHSALNEDPGPEFELTEAERVERAALGKERIMKAKAATYQREKKENPEEIKASSKRSYNRMYATPTRTRQG
jgi:hypothetical protein